MQEATRSTKQTWHTMTLQVHQQHQLLLVVEVHLIPDHSLVEADHIRMEDLVITVVNAQCVLTDTLAGVPTANAPLRMSGGINGVGSSPLAGQPISPVNRSLMMNVNGLRQPPPPTSHPLTLNQNKPRMDSSIPPQQNGTAYEMPGPMSNGIGRPAWELCLQFLPPTGPVDSILIGLLQRQRSIATQSTPSSLMTGPYHPDFRALLNPEVPNNFHPVMSIVSSLFQRIEYTGFAEKAAALFLVYHFVQWQILPTMETYHNLPDWYCPRPSQMVTAHPFWTSLVSHSFTDSVMMYSDIQSRQSGEDFEMLWLGIKTNTPRTSL